MNIKRGDDHRRQKLKHRGFQMRNKKKSDHHVLFYKVPKQQSHDIGKRQAHFLMRCSYPTLDADWPSCRP